MARATIDKIAPCGELRETPDLPEPLPNEIFYAPFSFPKFNAALDPKRTKSAAGMNGIDYEILKRLPFKYRLFLLNIFNDIHYDRKYPESWKNYFVHLIGKPGGFSFRPIVLTSCLGKLFETLMKNRLE